MTVRKKTVSLHQTQLTRVSGLRIFLDVVTGLDLALVSAGKCYHGHQYMQI